MGTQRDGRDRQTACRLRPSETWRTVACLPWAAGGGQACPSPEPVSVSLVRGALRSPAPLLVRPQEGLPCASGEEAGIHRLIYNVMTPCLSQRQPPRGARLVPKSAPRSSRMSCLVVKVGLGGFQGKRELLRLETNLHASECVGACGYTRGVCESLTRVSTQSPGLHLPGESRQACWRRCPLNCCLC